MSKNNPTKSVHPLHKAHKDQRAAESKRTSRIRKESKHSFLKTCDASEICKELADLDDMEFNPSYGPAALEHHCQGKTDEEWVKPGMMSERLASTAIKLKKERLNDRLDQMEKMYLDLKMQTTVDNIRNIRRGYQNARNRKAHYKDAINLAKSVKLNEIILPGQSLEMELSQKSQNIDTVGAVHVPKGGNREAIEAATRAKNKLRGVPPPPTIVLPRGFKRFRSGKRPPPPPMKKKEGASIERNDGPNYTNMKPGLDDQYGNIGIGEIFEEIFFVSKNQKLASISTKFSYGTSSPSFL